MALIIDMVKMKMVKKPYIIIKKAGAAYEYAGVKGTHLPRRKS